MGIWSRIKNAVKKVVKAVKKAVKWLWQKAKATGEDRLSTCIISGVLGGGQHLGLTLGIP